MTFDSLYRTTEMVSDKPCPDFGKPLSKPKQSYLTKQNDKI